MEYYLLTARSITHAQQMMRVLERAGIGTRVRRASAGLTKRGCGYTLQVSQRNYARAMDALSNAHQRPIKIFSVRNGVRQEV